MTTASDILPEIPRCGTCKHWERDTDIAINGYYYPTDLTLTLDEESAQQIAVEKLYGTCRGVVEVPENEDFESPNIPPIAFTMDASHYTAELHTQSTFGCVLHEEKDNDNQD